MSVALTARKIGLLVFIFASVGFGFVVAFMLLSTDALMDRANDEDDETPISAPVSMPVSMPQDDEPIEETVIPDQAFITDQGTIRLDFTNAQSEIIRLDRYAWKDLSFDPQGEYLAVLGDSELSGIFDLFIYDIEEESWEQASNYQQSPDEAGITSFLWKDNNTILFTQGPNSQHFLHRYTLDSNEIFKLEPVVGTITDISPDGERLVFESFENRVDDYFFTTIDGEFLYNFNNDNTSFLRFSEDENVLYANINNQISRLLLGSEDFQPVLDSQNKQMQCVVNDGAYVTDEANVFLEFFDFGTQEFTAIVSLPTLQGEFYCDDRDVYIQAETIEGIVWYRVNTETANVIEVTALQDYQELTIF